MTPTARPLVVSKVSPPGTKPASRGRSVLESEKAYALWIAATADTRAFYIIFEDRSGEQVEYRRGWTKLAWCDQIAEAWPGRCPGCVGEKENGLVNPDGTREERFSTTHVLFYENHGTPCATCRQRSRVEALRKITALMRDSGLTVADIEGAAL